MLHSDIAVQECDASKASQTFTAWPKIKNQLLQLAFTLGNIKNYFSSLAFRFASSASKNSSVYK